MSQFSRRELLTTLLRGSSPATGKKWWADAGDRGATTEIGLTAAPSPATASSASDVLVVVLLYGGFDGLTAVPPIGDPHYAPARPTIAVPKAKALPIDGLFGLHPAMAPLLPWWKSKHLAAVHAVGIPFPTRSHFQAQQDLGQAAPGTALTSGWMNRSLTWLGDRDALAATQVGNSVLTASLAGPAPVTTLWEVNDFSLVGQQWAGPKLASSIKSLYTSVSSTTSATAVDTLAACRDLASLQNTTYHPANGAIYPSGDLGSALQGTAQLIKSGVGARLVAVEYGDWDFHAGLGGTSGGAMALMLADLAGSLAAFATDLGSELGRVTVVTMSEFGRRVGENGSGGVDHGHGNAMLVLGGNVNGGKVYGTWPTLAPSALDDGDLAGTTDYRSILSELLVRRCGLSSVSTVFPGFSPHFLGIA